MIEKTSLSKRWDNLEPTKKFVFWACVASAGLTAMAGFNWGGWVTGGTAKSMVQEAADETRIEIAIAGCLDRFGRGPDAAARMVALKATEGWQRGLYLESKGWTTLVGTEDTVSGAGEPCATQLLAAAV